MYTNCCKPSDEFNNKYGTANEIGMHDKRLFSILFIRYVQEIYTLVGIPVLHFVNIVRCHMKKTNGPTFDRVPHISNSCSY